MILFINSFFYIYNIIVILDSLKKIIMITKSVFAIFIATRAFKAISESKSNYQEKFGTEIL